MTPIDDERQKFEAWARRYGSLQFDQVTSGYVDDSVEMMWMAWQAARAEQAETPQDCYGCIEQQTTGKKLANAFHGCRQREQPSLTGIGWFVTRRTIKQAFRLPDDPTPAETDMLHEFLGETKWESDRDGGLVIHTLEGYMHADSGDWIIRGVKGEFYPCKPDIFALNYEPFEAAAVPVEDRPAPTPEMDQSKLSGAFWVNSFTPEPQLQPAPLKRKWLSGLGCWSTGGKEKP